MAAALHETMSEEKTATQRPLLRKLQGVVASDKADKTIKVLVEYQQQHPKYGKILSRRTVLHVHDEANLAKEGDGGTITIQWGDKVLGASFKAK